ncbi:MAG: hypothetical protein ACLS9I_08380, partial [Adlercreutzia equolifaciens]
DQPTLGGVYKLAAVRAGEDAPWTARLKISESAAKLTTPGVLDVRRYYQSDGRIAGDMVFDVNETPDAREVIVDPMDDLRQKNLSGLRFRDCCVLWPVPARWCSRRRTAAPWPPAPAPVLVWKPLTKLSCVC